MPASKFCTGRHRRRPRFSATGAPAGSSHQPRPVPRVRRVARWRADEVVNAAANSRLSGARWIEYWSLSRNLRLGAAVLGDWTVAETLGSRATSGARLEWNIGSSDLELPGVGAAGAMLGWEWNSGSYDSDSEPRLLGGMESDRTRERLPRGLPPR